MNPPFGITIEKITEARQCYHAVSQLLRIFPSLRLTITANETIPTPAGPPQTIGFADIPALVADCIASLYPRSDIRDIRELIDKGIARRADARIAGEQAERLRSVGAHVCPSEEERAASSTADGWAKFRASEAERKAARCAPSADSKSPPSHAWKPDEHAEDRRNNHSDSDVDDSAYQ